MSVNVLLSTIILVSFIVTLILAVGSYMAYKVRERRRPDFVDPLDIAVYNFVREPLDKHSVSDHLYRPVLIRIGEQGVVELVALVGYYTLIAMTLNTFQIPTPDGKSPFV